MEDSAPGPLDSGETKAPLLIGITALLHAISLPLVAARIWTRSRPTFRLALDDYLILAAMAFDLVNWSFMLVSVHYGMGRHNIDIAPDRTVLAEKWLFISQPFYAWAMSLAKMSIAWMLIRIRYESRVWVVGMSAVMIICLGVAISANTFALTMCTPVWAIWDHSNPDAVCEPPRKAEISIYVNAALMISTDLVLSLSPITFIFGILRPLREKIILTVIMGVGLLASAASIAKTFKAKDYGATGDVLMDSVELTIWSILESQLAIIASCIPTLKRPVEKILRRKGWIGDTPPPVLSFKFYRSVDEESQITQPPHRVSNK